MDVIRFLCNLDHKALQNGIYLNNTITVYYGCNNYKRTVEHIHMLTMAIKDDFPDMSIADMEVYEITKSQSDRHAHHTMIRVSVSSQFVKSKFKEFQVL